jgi:hypothetical protein
MKRAFSTRMFRKSASFLERDGALGMKVTAKINFLANGVPGHPGKVLSFEEMEQVQNILVDMQIKGLVDVELTQEEPDLVVEPIQIAEPQVEAPKPKKPRSKKKGAE